MIQKNVLKCWYVLPKYWQVISIYQTYIVIDISVDLHCWVKLPFYSKTAFKTLKVEIHSEFVSQSSFILKTFFMYLLCSSFCTSVNITSTERRHDTEHNDTQHKGLTCDTYHKWHLAYTALGKTTLCHYAECDVLFIIMLSVVAPCLTPMPNGKL